MGDVYTVDPGARDLDAVADLAGLLALAWGQPDQMLAQALLEESWADSVRECVELLLPNDSLPGLLDALGVLAVSVAGSSPVTLAIDLAAEYAALFQGPGRALVKAYECQWVEAEGATLFIAPTSLAVEASYRAAGLEVATHEPPDCLATELAFVRYLAQAEAPGRVSERRRVFLTAHVDRWAGRFCEAVEQATEHGAYAALARITAIVVDARLLHSATT